MSSTLNWVVGVGAAICILLLVWIFYVYANPTAVLSEKTISKSPYVAALKDSIHVIDNKLDQVLLQYKTGEARSIITKDKVVYKVQVASYKKYDAVAVPKKPWEISPNGYLRIAIGDFPSYAQANYFKEELKKVGFSKDIYLISVLNDEQVEMKEALALTKEKL